MLVQKVDREMFTAISNFAGKLSECLGPACDWPILGNQPIKFLYFTSRAHVLLSGK